MNREKILDLKTRANHIFIDNIMRFWASEYLLDRKNGGFWGRIKLDMSIVADEPRALVVNGRMVYAFSKAYLLTGDELYRSRAKRAFDYLITYFRDPIYKGAYNLINYQGVAVDPSKPTYAESFFMYACGAYYEATQDPLAYEIGMETFHTIEEKVKLQDGVYAIGFTRDWNRLSTLFRTDSRGNNQVSTEIQMFQHHLCQAYEQFYRATKNEEVGKALLGFLRYANEILYDREHRCFMNVVGKNGTRVSTRQSLGHDCEIGYLMLDIAEQLADEELLAKTREIVLATLETVYQNAIGKFGNFIGYVDLETGQKSDELIWWSQAEGVSGMFVAYQLTGNEKYLDAADTILTFIEKNYLNEKDGDWYSSFLIDDQGHLTMIPGEHDTDKLNAGKCPYHNSRMCLELMARADKLLA
jgi:mannobiose 2-epimerase